MAKKLPDHAWHGFLQTVGGDLSAILRQVTDVRVLSDTAMVLWFDLPNQIPAVGDTRTHIGDRIRNHFGKSYRLVFMSNEDY